MQSLPIALESLRAYNQFILWKLATREGKEIKLPISPHTLQVYPKDSGWQQDPTSWTDADTAIKIAGMCGSDYGVGFFFTHNDPFYFVDLDDCLQPGGVWSPVALEIMNQLPGAAVEVSQSGTGLHIIGKGRCPDHASKNVPLRIELYTEARFCALTGTNIIGNAGIDSTAHLPGLVDTYFPAKVLVGSDQWTTTHALESAPIEDDDELIAKAMATTSAAGAFGGAASFANLWTNDIEVLAGCYPDPEENNPYDRSSADAALLQHLAFWTGNNCDRMMSLMWQSGLVRDKWKDREGYYLDRSITKACSMQATFYTGGNKPINADGERLAEQYGAPKLKGDSEGQLKFANNVRAQMLVDCLGNEELIEQLCTITTAKIWLNGKNKTPTEIVASITPIDHAADPFGKGKDIEIVGGYQFLTANMQIEHFAGCTYVQNQHRVFSPVGAFLKDNQFNATYGGYVFQLDESGDKTTKKAWEAFTESQVVRYPKAQEACFRPSLPSCALIDDNGSILVNTYIPIDTPRIQGDVSPFLNHLDKLLPDPNDRSILLAYMAACIQHKGVKFQWAPLVQGAEGNGKTLFSRCVAFAVGEQHVHWPRADEMAEKFNEWLFNKIFIGVEDIYVPDHKKEIIEVLKPMITNDRLAMRAMQSGQVMNDNVANFILNTNHKDAMRKTRNDRRFCIFYTAQQHIDDIERDGMGGDYFPNLYDWLKGDGYAIVADYLASYAIPDALNPATSCHRAPDTTSTAEAVTASMGSIEQEILEAIDEDRPGFAGGWVSSMAIERLLQMNRMSRAIPHNKRRELMQSLGYDWHPALNKGRVNNFVAFDQGKPRIFVKDGHLNCELKTAAEVVRHYQDAQGIGVTNATQAFGS